MMFVMNVKSLLEMRVKEEWNVVEDKLNQITLLVCNVYRFNK